MLTYTPQQLLHTLEKLAPLALAEDWDNAGLLVACDTPVTRVLTALEITPAVLAEAVEKGCQLIVCHHPVIFDPLKSIDHNSIVYQLIRAGVSAICMHTNLDIAPGGTGDTLAGLLGLANVRPFGHGNLGRLGTLPQPMSAAALAALCKQKLRTAVRFVNSEKPLHTVAIVTGAGGSAWADAQTAGAEVLLTGEAKHHDALDAAAAGMALIAAGHWGTEAPIAAVLAQFLQRECSGLEVFVSESMADPFCDC